MTKISKVPPVVVGLPVPAYSPQDLASALRYDQELNDALKKILDGLCGYIGHIRSSIVGDSGLAANVKNLFPSGDTDGTLTPTAHGANIARVHPFCLPFDMEIKSIRILTNAILANCLQCGIYRADGSLMWQSGVLSTIPGWVSVSDATAEPNYPLDMPAGFYFWASTNNNVISDVAAYRTNALPYSGPAFFGTVPAAMGVLPSSFDPYGITRTAGPFVAWVQLSSQNV